MASASIPEPETELGSGLSPTENLLTGSSQGVAWGASEQIGSSTHSDIRACVQLLEQLWPRPEASPAEGTIDSIVEKLGRFRILRELGRGGFGVVFLAVDPDLGRNVALKVPRVEVLAHGEGWRRFLREAQAASRLDHPNLVPLLETGTVGAVAYIASVYVDGPSLESWLARRHDSISPRQAASLVAVLARAIEHAHQRGILHRDLKPANVLLQPGSSDAPLPGSASLELPFVPRICDFGLAKLMESDAEESRSMVAAGSPSYMAPEQAEGKKALISRATDVYGLGAILYQVLSGRPPFGGPNTLETLRRVVAEEPVPLRRNRPGLPRDLETICLKCLQKRPDRRYPTAAALADDLQRFLDGRPTTARPPGPAEGAWKWARRRPALTAILLLGALSAAGAAAGLVVLERTNDKLARVLKQEQELVATYRIRQAQQAVAMRSFDQARELLNRAANAEGAAGAKGFAWNYLDRQLKDRVPVLEGHESPVTALSGSPDGSTLASGDGGGIVRLWDLKSRSSRLLGPSHHGAVHEIRFSPDGHTLATAARMAPGELFLWEVSTGKYLGRARHRGQAILGQWFSSDGASVVALNSAPFNHPHRLLVWDITNLNTEPRIPDQAALNALGLIDPRIQAVADLLDGRGSCSALRQPWSVQAPRGLAFTSDGSLVVAAHGDGMVQLLSASGGGVACSGRFDPSGGISLLYSHGSATLLGCRAHLDRLEAHAREHSHGSDLQIRAYYENKSLLSPSGHEAVITPHRGAGLSLVDSLTWQEKASVGMDPPASIGSMTFLPDGRSLACGTDDHRVILWRLDPRDPPTTGTGHSPKEAWDVAFSPDGRLLASSGDDHLIRIWDAATGEQLRTLKGHASLVTAVAWSPTGTVLASAGWDHTVRIWDAVSGKPGAVLNGHTEHVRAVAFSPDGATLASAGDDHSVRVWDVNSATAVASLTAQTVDRGGLAFSSNGRTLATGSVDGQVLLWDRFTNKTRTLTLGPRVHKLAFSPGGNVLAVVHQYAPPRLWDLQTEQPLAHLLGHREAASHLAFSPDGRTVATSGIDRTVRIWDATSGQEMLCLTGHQARVNSVAFSPDGRTLASADHSGAIRFWRSTDPDGPAGRR
jgi:WD40 repeat protein